MIRLAMGLLVLGWALPLRAQSARLEPFRFRGLAVEVTGTASIAANGTAEPPPARVCVLARAGKACYSPPRAASVPLDFSYDPHAEVVALSAGRDALFFTATASGGGSGSLTSLALLDFDGRRLRDLLPPLALTNQSEYRFWHEPGRPVLLATADFVWGKGETHFSAHRYDIRVYGPGPDGRFVRLDRYTTRHKYPGLDDVEELSVLEGERRVILTRLKSRPSGVAARS